MMPDPDVPGEPPPPPTYGRGALTCHAGAHYARATYTPHGYLWTCTLCGATRIIKTETEWTRP